MVKRSHAIMTDAEKCVGCVACSQICPTQAVRVRGGLAHVKDELCIDCGACIDVCRYDAIQPRTSSPADLKRFKHTVAVPSLTLYAQFGDVHPGHVMQALCEHGFDDTYDISWMCEMVAGATDAYLSECEGPWPKISVTCPAVLRLVQIRYPDLLPNLLPFETPRELAAKMRRRRLASELGLAADEIGIFFITPCTAIMNSIVNPVGLEASNMDGAFSIAELFGPLQKTLRTTPPSVTLGGVSVRGLRWAMAGGEIAGMRNANSMTVKGLRDVTYVFDRIEAGTFQAVDFIEAYICPDGCVSGQLTIAGRYAAQKNLHSVIRRLGEQTPSVNEEKVRALLREHFFDFEEEIRARSVQPLADDLRTAIALKREIDSILELLPKKDCGACGAPTCAAFAGDVIKDDATITDCVFIQVERLRESLKTRLGGQDE
jgi:Na+-translocating ferredoxin:NAD+ oxidoreductase RNF subunit RnfB